MKWLVLVWFLFDQTLKPLGIGSHILQYDIIFVSVDVRRFYGGLWYLEQSFHKNRVQYKYFSKAQAVGKEPKQANSLTKYIK